jgi:hypothetical protein
MCKTRIETIEWHRVSLNRLLRTYNPASHICKRSCRRFLAKYARYICVTENPHHPFWHRWTCIYGKGTGSTGLKIRPENSLMLPWLLSILYHNKGKAPWNKLLLFPVNSGIIIFNWIRRQTFPFHTSSRTTVTCAYLPFEEQFINWAGEGRTASSWMGGLRWLTPFRVHIHNGLAWSGIRSLYLLPDFHYGFLLFLPRIFYPVGT